MNGGERCRLFIAAWPPEPLLERLEALPRPGSPGVRYTTRDQWHVTLRFLGDADPAVATSALEQVRPLPAPPVATLGPRVTRLGRHVVVVPVAGLGALAAAVAEATAEVGRPPDPRPFSGHITLARLRGRATCDAVGAGIGGEFAVDRVHLVRSDLGHSGARYRTLTTVAVTPDAPRHGG